MLDTPAEDGFDDLARLAAQLCNTPVGLVTFVDDARQFFKARAGFDGGPSAPLDQGFCPYVVRGAAPLVIPDTHAHPEHAGNSATTGGGVRFYAGVPLVTGDGHALGTLCVLDHAPRSLSPDQHAGLGALANQVVGQLELRRALRRAAEEGERAEREAGRVAGHARRSDLLARASARLLTATDAEEIVSGLYADLAEALQLDVCFNYACQDGGLGLVASVGLTLEQETLAARLEFGQTICGMVAASREAVHVTGIQDGDDPQAAFLKALGLDTYASTPLLVGDDLLGTLSFGRRAGPFLPEEFELLRTLVSYAAMALHRLDAAHALAASEGQLRFALDAGRLGAWGLDLATGEMTTSSTFRANFGRDPAEPFTYAELRADVHPDDRERTEAAVARSLATGADYDVEYRALTPTGELRWVHVRARPTLAPDGAPARMDGISLDITSRKRAEERLRASEEFSRRVVASSSDCIEVVDLAGRLESLDGGGRRLLGGDEPEALVGTPWPELISGTSRDAAVAALARARAGGTGRFEGTRAASRGEARWWDMAVTPILDADGRPRKLLVTSRDVTERRRAEEHQRLLINELNHRVKNSLATVQSIAYQTLRGADVPEAARGAFTDRLVALARAHDVLTEESWEGADLAEVVAGALDPHGGRDGERFRLSGPPVRLAPKTALSLAMALHELATNAAKYGALTVPDGRVEVAWDVGQAEGQRRLRLRWTESGGPPVAAPSRKGFGSRLIERGLAAELRGAARLLYEPTGLVCAIDALLPTAG